ncbi:DUF3829 domain-containing protein [Budviciaceae bacterium CWB-B4]|uniref:DUF3829 domain-containing protein n=1 Tax=Limnobaculum xujianqingii TaxID=2738837 RepID=A0A9D7AFC7_9GAMM|nr:DUF3829 domain-containing protein [Limnobaculum xujianqingii]MBK5071710.1 DUF3829 domain-containing protein [Limnobaculum xujianqingii]MBK5175019.1 DUF3829 domain-containing protein [Limnobaculum xujianqingii]
MKKIGKALLFGTLVFNTALLAGCDDKPEAPKASSGAPTTQNSTSAKKSSAPEANKSEAKKPAISDEKAAYKLSEKVSYYVKATNAYGGGVLDGTSSWPDKEKKVKAGIEKKDYRVIESWLYFSSRPYSSLSNNLKKALKVTEVNIDNIDPKAEAIVASIDKLLPVWEELEKYNKMKKYEDDNGAKGKELMEVFTPGFNQVNEQYKALEAEIRVASEEMKQKRIENYKKEGRLLELYTEESLELARSIVGQFSTLKDYKDKAKIDQANKYLAELEEKLELQTAEYNKAKEEGKKVDSGYSRVNDRLVKFVGTYRDARKKPGSYANNLVKDFNSAIDTYNSIR